MQSVYSFDEESQPLTQIKCDNNNLFGSDYDRLQSAALMRRRMFSSKKVISHCAEVSAGRCGSLEEIPEVDLSTYGPCSETLTRQFFRDISGVYFNNRRRKRSPARLTWKKKRSNFKSGQFTKNILSDNPSVFFPHW